MKRVLYLYLLSLALPCQARKDKVTVYNQSDSTVLVAIDTKERQPIRKDSIDARQARNFYLPDLTEQQPYYLLIDSEGEQRLFSIHLVGHNVVLRRGDYDVGQVPSSVFETGGLSLVVYGAMFPYLPEAKIISSLSSAERQKILHPEEEPQAAEVGADTETKAAKQAVFEAVDGDEYVPESSADEQAPETKLNEGKTHVPSTHEGDLEEQEVEVKTTARKTLEQVEAEAELERQAQGAKDEQ